jgi:hypothetical protein
MTLTLTCRHCGTVLTADSEDELAALGQRHARAHGHTRGLPSETVLARIRRHNPNPPADTGGAAGEDTAGGDLHGRH